MVNSTGYSLTTAGDNQIYTDGVWTYTYDADGNVTEMSMGSSATTWFFAYNLDNQVISAKEYTTPTGTLEQEIDYGYDVFGDMISRVVSVSGSSTTHFAYDVSNASPGINDSVNPLYAELSSGGTITERYLYDANGNLAARTGSDTDGVAWLITDYQGSVRDILTAAGAWEGTVSYDGFGNIISASETGAAITGNYAFQGMYLDRALTLGAGNGTNEAKYRFELPDGQWTAQDQTGLGPDVNDRREMGNDGTNAVDPSGLQERVRTPMSPPPPPPNLKIFTGENPATPIRGPSGWSVINALGLPITLNAVQMKAINDWAVADDRYHDSLLAPLDPATLPADNVLRKALEGLNAQTITAVQDAASGGLKGACQTKVGTQAFVWQNTTTKGYHTTKFDPEVDRLEIAFAHLDNSKIGRDTSGGSPANRRATKWARSIGEPTDDAGHAIGFQLGGSGRKEDGNIFPQNPEMNQGPQKKYEGLIAKFAKDNPNGCVTILVMLVYNDPKEGPLSRRPAIVLYGARLTDNAGIMTPQFWMIRNPK